MIAAVALLAGTLAARAGDTGTDPARKYAWGENVGWLNAHSDHHTVTIHYSEGTGGWLTGHLWAENIGWIVMGSVGGGPYANDTGENWGVNLEGGGWLSGYAWGENVGWIKFEQTHGQPAIDATTGTFAGHAWGENIAGSSSAACRRITGCGRRPSIRSRWARRTGGWRTTAWMKSMTPGTMSRPGASS